MGTQQTRLNVTIFEHPKHMLETLGKKNIYNYKLKMFINHVHLNLRSILLFIGVVPIAILCDPMWYLAMHNRVLCFVRMHICIVSFESALSNTNMFAVKIKASAT